MIGQTISHYRILEKLGEGGMGVVYKAEDTKLHRPVALKFLPPELTRDPEAKERFTHEAQAASSLDHPNIAVIHEIDQMQDGSSFICMAYYEGETLKKKIAAGPIRIEEAVHIAYQLAEGLQRAHEAGIVHRDIKPANVIVTKRGEVKIVDFGLAKLIGGTKITKTGRTVGTAAYMSPEQARGDPVDHQTDIWSFGVVLYEMLTGQLPFKSEYEQAAFYSILNENPPPVKGLRSDVTLELETIVNKCLEKDPSQRYQTAVELLRQLKRTKREMSSREVVVEKPKIARALPSWQSVRKYVGPLAVVTIVVLLVVLFPSGRKAVEDWLSLTAIPEEKHLAVLPFADVDEDPTKQAFWDGFFETLNGKLTQLEQFQNAFWVVPASEIHKSTEMYKREISNASDARQAFGVNLVVTGHTQVTNDRFRLTLALVDAKSLRELKSSTIDGRMKNVTVLQGEPVSKVARMLNVELPAQAQRVLNAGATSVPQAYEFYLRGRGYLQRSKKIVDLVTAISSLKQAIKQDSLYASAHAALGECYWRRYESSKDIQWVEAAVKTCKRAIELDGRLASAHVILGLIHTRTGKYEEAVKEFEEALALNPSSTAAYRGLAKAYEARGSLKHAESTYRKAINMKPDFWAGYKDLGIFYYLKGRYDDAVKQFHQVVVLTPDDYLAYSNLGGIYYYQERFADAREMFERSLAIKQSYEAFSNLGTVYHLQGRYADAASMYTGALDFNDRDHQVWGNLASAYFWTPGEREKALEIYQRAIKMAEEEKKASPNDAHVLSLLAGYYSMTGQRHKALPLIEEALTLAPKNGEVLYRAGHAYEQLGKREKALQSIEEALENGYSLAEIEREPGLRRLRADVRFQQLLQSSGLQSGID